MAAAREIDSDRLGPAPGQLALVGIAEHPVLGENRERWNLQSFPLVPARFMHSLDRALHDRGVETRDEPIIRRLEIRYPGINDRVITEELAGSGLVPERNRPGREVRAETSSLARTVTPRHMTFEHHEPLDQVWARCCCEKSSVGSHRLPDERRSTPWGELLDRRHDVADESVAG